MQHTYRDTFTDTDGTPLSLHLPDAGFLAWALDPNYGPQEALIELDRATLPYNIGSGGGYKSSASLAGIINGFDIFVDLSFSPNIGYTLGASVGVYEPRYDPSPSVLLRVGYANLYEEPSGWFVSSDYFDNSGVVRPFLLGTNNLRLGLVFDPAVGGRFYREPFGGGARTYLNAATPVYDSIENGPAFFELVSGDDTGPLAIADNLTITTNPPRSTIAAASATIEAGPVQSTITVTAKDDLGAPIVGATVLLSATGTDNAITQPVGVTGPDGVAIGYISSTKAEMKTVSATANGGDLGVTVGVTVTAAPPDPGLSFLDPSLLDTTAGAPPAVIAFHARDRYNNPVPDYTPTTTPPLPFPPGPTDVDGNAEGFYSGTVAGTFDFTVSWGGGGQVVVDPGPLDHFEITVPAETMRGGQTVTRCTAKDAFGNAVTDFTGQLDLTATGTRLMGTPVRTAAFVAGIATPVLVFMDVASAALVQGVEVGGGHAGISNPFAVVEPWGRRAPAGGSFAPGASSAGVWRPVPDREWEDRDG